MLEAEVEAYLVKRAEDLGGEVRKVKWAGRKGAPDRLVMLPPLETMDGYMEKPACTLWVELKRPGKAATFPANAHERQQDREHERMRQMGQRVFVVDSIRGVDQLLARR